MKTVKYSIYFQLGLLLLTNSLKSQTEEFTDPRDGIVYSTVPIGNQTWMGEDLKLDVPGSCIPCFYEETETGEIIETCADNGMFYNWIEAMNIDNVYIRGDCYFDVINPHQGICPTGWHVPSADEWTEFETFVESSPEINQLISDFNPTIFTSSNVKYCFAHSATSYISTNQVTGEFEGLYDFSAFGFSGLPDISLTNTRKYWKYPLRCIRNTEDITIPLIELNSVIPTTNTITAKIYLVNEGNSPVEFVGLCWSINPDPTPENSESINLSDFHAGTFDGLINGLNINTTYYVRAYASNESGTTYSNQKIIKTLEYSSPTGNYIIDSRDGRIYKIGDIGNQTWMIEDLDFNAPGGYCLPCQLDDITGDTIWCRHDLGKFYDYAQAMNIDPIYAQNSNDYFDVTYPHQGSCPTGYHLPSEDEWTEFETFVENSPEMNELLTEFNPSIKSRQHPCRTNKFGLFELCHDDCRIDDGYISSTQFLLSETFYLVVYCETDASDSPFVLRSGPRFHKFPIRCIKNDGEINMPLIELISILPIDNTATAKIYLVNEGNSAVESLGLEWHVAPNSANAVTDKINLNELKASATDGQIEFDDFYAGTFDKFLSDLLPNTTYYIRAFATNSYGTSYSNEITYISPATDNEPPIIIPPENITVFNDPGKCSATFVLTDPEVTDNYGIESISNNAPAEFPIGITKVTWSAIDINGNESTTEQFVTVINEIPVINSISTTIDPVQLNTAINVTANYTDNNITNGLWEWGDETTTASIINSEILGNHYYSEPGVFTVHLVVTDACGETANEDYQYVVVYDPQGGFVTGGGWINSPTGASTQFPEAIGKANFGFESKYKKGVSIPEGNTEFQFKAGNLDFKSNSYDWLVIAGSKAMFKGEGQINQAGRYGFLLSAIDGNLKIPAIKDLFRIRIWDKNNNDIIIYDNEIASNEYGDPTTQIAGGSIVIHNPKIKNIRGLEEIAEMTNQKIYFDAFPNPFNNTVFINYKFPTNEKIALMLLDMNGRIVKDLFQGIVEKGVNYMIDYTPDEGIKNGVYLLNLITSDGQTYIKRLILNK